MRVRVPGALEFPETPPLTFLTRRLHAGDAAVVRAIEQMLGLSGLADAA